jgi:chromosome segregation ATPase
MTDEIKQGQTVEPETVKTEPAKDQNIDELRAELESLRKESELKKNEIATRDKKLTEYQKELKSKMTEEERLKAEAEAERKEWLDDMAKIQAETLGLDEKHASLIKGANKQEIKESAELIKSLIDSISVEKDKQIKKLEDELKTYKAAGEAPKGGNTTPASARQSLINQYNEAEAKGDADKMFYLKEQIRKLPK